MGTTLGYLRLSETNADLLLRHPRLIHPFLAGEEGPASPPVTGGFWSRLLGGKREAPEPPPVLEPRQEGDEQDADKAWHAIHYLLTGSANQSDFPEGFILDGGTQVGEDIGYGPPRVFKPGEVSRIDALLQPITRETFHARYDGARLDAAKVYPEIWQRDGDEGFEYIWDFFSIMQAFIHDTARKQQCLLLYLG